MAAWIGAVTGHKTRSVLDRYDIVSQAHLREGVEKLHAATAAASVTSGQSGTVRQMPRSSERQQKWCRRGDSNPYGLATTGF